MSNSIARPSAHMKHTLKESMLRLLGGNIRTCQTNPIGLSYILYTIISNIPPFFFFFFNIYIHSMIRITNNNNNDDNHNESGFDLKEIYFDIHPAIT